VGSVADMPARRRNLIKGIDADPAATQTTAPDLGAEDRDRLVARGDAGLMRRLARR
jgi:hypothetical protein